MSKPAKPKMAICYDFDGTLAPKNMQEYDYIPQLKMSSKQFWNEVHKRAREQKSDEILAYMRLMIEQAEGDRSADGIKITRQDFSNYARKVKFFQGVKEWFGSINQYGKNNGIIIEHYIISSGIREMIEGTSIARYFTKIYASSFMYDQNDVAYWPSMVVNYTTKTQFLFRINKGHLDEWDNSKINAYKAKEERPIPFDRIIYVGDGTTDIPCMRLVKDQGGYAIAVFHPGKSTAKACAANLLTDGRVNFVAPADYREGKVLDKQIKSVVNKIVADYAVQQLIKRSEKNYAVKTNLSESITTGTAEALPDNVIKMDEESVEKKAEDT